MAIQLSKHVADHISKSEAQRGRVNIYTCNDCGERVATKDTDVGVTPFMIGCRATDGCRGMMQSSLYRVSDPSLAPSLEWYRPDSTEGLSNGERQHVEMGGLLMRPLATSPNT